MLICLSQCLHVLGFRKVLKSYHQILKWWLQGLHGFNIGLKKVLRRFLKNFDGFYKVYNGFTFLNVFTSSQKISRVLFEFKNGFTRFHKAFFFKKKGFVLMWFFLTAVKKCLEWFTKFNKFKLGLQRCKWCKTTMVLVVFVTKVTHSLNGLEKFVVEMFSRRSKNVFVKKTRITKWLERCRNGSEKY